MSMVLQWVKLIGLAMAVIPLAACNILPEPSPQDIYRLPASSVVAATAQDTTRSLRIPRPSANELLSTNRIVVVPQGNQLNVYPGARWSSPAPILWRDHLLDAFRNDGRIARLSSGWQRLQADVELISALRAFQIEYRAGAPEVIIHLDAQLVETAGNRIIASRRFAVREAVEGEQLPVVVEAFGRASDILATELIDWTVQQVTPSPG